MLEMLAEFGIGMCNIDQPARKGIDTPLVEAEYRLEAVSADPRVARALGIAAGSPIFLIERTSYTTGHQPIDYEKLYYRGDHIRFVTRLARCPRTERAIR